MAGNKRSAAADSSLRIFVRRGAVRRFNKLKTESAHLPVAIEWDRRKGDRSPEPAAASSMDRPAAADRRVEPPFTWTLADFVLVEGEEKPVADVDLGSSDDGETRKP